MSQASLWPPRAKKASILLAFGGVDGNGSEDQFQNEGHASGRQLSMSIRGKAYASTNPEALKKILWFFAHEVAHQFQFRDGLTREAGSDWISEGAGNLILHGTRKPLKGICFGVVCPQGQHQLTIAQGLHLDHLPKSMILFT